MKSFVQAAAEIPGWRSCDCQNFGVESGNPIMVRPHSGGDTPLHAEDSTACEQRNWCCHDCGRPLHEGLDSAGVLETVAVSRRELNHVLNSLREAIDFCRERGPNNNLTWEAALEALVVSLKSTPYSGNAS
jgi:hypothetical protein